MHRLHVNDDISNEQEIGSVVQVPRKQVVSWRRRWATDDGMPHRDWLPLSSAASDWLQPGQ